MDFWSILFVIDWLLFATVALTVIYLGVFAVASFFGRKHEVPKSRKQKRFVVLIPAYKQDEVIE